MTATVINLNSVTGLLGTSAFTSADAYQTASTNLTSLASLAYSANAFVKMTSANTFTLDTNAYLTSNQAITLTGDVSGAGTTAITTTIGANKVTGAMLALGSDAQGDVMYYNGTDWVRLSAGTSGQFLKTQGASTNPVWADDNNTIYAASGSLLSLAGGVFSLKEGTLTSGKLCTFDGTNLVCNTDSGSVGHAAMTLSGTVDYLTAVGQQVTLNQIDLTTDVAGVLPIANGGTGRLTGPTSNGQLLIGSGSSYALSTLTASTGISITNAAGSITISNTGVVSLIGTDNQVTVAANGGNITLSLPQSIATASDVQFKSLRLSDALTVAYGGTGLSSVSQNSILYASGANILSSLTPSADQILVTNSSGVPNFTNLSADNFTQYALLAGRSGGQTLNGGTVASNNLVLDSNSTATKGYVLLNPTGGNVGIGTTSPSQMLTVGNNNQFTVSSAGAVAGGTYNGNTFTTGTGTLNLASYSLELSGSSNINQNLLTTSTPTFAGLTLNGTLTQSGSTTGYLASLTNTDVTSGGGLYIQANGTGNLLTLNNAGTDILTVSPVQASFNVPTSFNTVGDVSIANDLILTNQTATSLKTNSSFTLDVGESFEANSLTLKTYNAGEVIVDGGSVAAYPLHVYRSTDGNVAGFTDTNGTCAINPTNTALVCSSDATMKKDVVTLASADALAAVNTLRLVNFHWNKEETTDPLHTGIIAQEIATILPNLVSIGLDGKLAVNYLGLVPYTLSAIQQQQLQIADVTTNLSALGLKTDASVTTLAGLQTSVDANLVTINGKFTALDSALATQATTLVTLQTQATAANAVATELQAQIEEIKLQNERYDALNQLMAIIDPTTLIFADSLGNLDLLNGKLEAAELTAGVLTIKIVDPESLTLGQATVVIGQDSVVVSTKAITPTSKIFITPVNSTPPMTQKTIERKDDTPIVLEIPITWSISEQLTGTSFTVKTSGLVSQEMKFNWWIVQEQSQ